MKFVVHAYAYSLPKPLYIILLTSYISVLTGLLLFLLKGMRTSWNHIDDWPHHDIILSKTYYI